MSNNLLKTAPGNEDNHYTGSIQPIEFIENQGLGFHEANAIKYLCRWKKKNGIQDLEKAVWYIQRLIECTKEKADREVIKEDYIMRDPL